MEENLCSGKKVYTKKEAQTVLNFLQGRGNGKNLRIYQCPYCDFWHLTHKQKYGSSERQQIRVRQ